MSIQLVKSASCIQILNTPRQFVGSHELLCSKKTSTEKSSRVSFNKKQNARHSATDERKSFLPQGSLDWKENARDSATDKCIASFHKGVQTGKRMPHTLPQTSVQPPSTRESRLEREWQRQWQRRVEESPYLRDVTFILSDCVKLIQCSIQSTNGIF